MSLQVDENGIPFILLRDEEKKQRVMGLEAQKAHIAAARQVADLVKTSFGPRGMDKIIVGPDGELTVTNDGATILDKMEIENECARLLVDLSKGQDAEMGDGTTGVVVLAGAMLQESLGLLERRVHPLRITDGIDKAADVALAKLDAIAETCDNDKNKDSLIAAAETALSSKVVSMYRRHLAEVAVEAVLTVVDKKTQDVNFDLIKIDTRPTGQMSDTCIIKGIVLEKEFSHSQMKDQVENVKIAVLTCPFEPPRPKTKHELAITTGEQYHELLTLERKYFDDMIRIVEASGANVVMCQWGLDDEANHLLAKKGISTIRWVGGAEMELLSIATGATIVPRFEDLKPESLGRAKSVKQLSKGTQGDKLVVIETTESHQTVTILVHGSNNIIAAEAERCLHDAICCVRNLLRDNRIVWGGGAAEVACSLAVEAYGDSVPSVEQHAVMAFATALLAIPYALADNAGLDPLEATGEVKRLQRDTKKAIYGIPATTTHDFDMRSDKVHESLQAKKHQISLAAQVTKMILKVDDIIMPREM